MTDRVQKYAQCALPNMFFEYYDNGNFDVGVNQPSYRMSELMGKLSRAFPSWKIFGTMRSRTDRVAADGSNIYTMERFRIESSRGEKLGNVWYGYGRGSTQGFCIDNDQMGKARQRGDSTFTADVERAFKLIKANFKPLPLTSLLSDKERAVNTVIHRTVNTAQRAYGAQYNTLSAEFLSFAQANWEQFIRYLNEYPCSAAALAAATEFHPVAEAMNKAQALQEQRNGTEPATSGITVYVRDEHEYVMIQNGKFHIRTTEELTTVESACIGMLKLVPVDTFIPNYGVRADTDTFYITPHLVPPMS
jgi:hypothetical protein